MPSPFPGMNPYFEHPDIWPEVHHLLISVLAETLNPHLLPKYRAAIEKRVYQMTGDEAVLVCIPDVTVAQKIQQQPTSTVAIASPPVNPVSVTVPMPMEFREGYLEVREIATREVVTVIEILSPTNKRPGIGQESYLSKRLEVLASRTHLVEIDLLRTGEPMPILGSQPNTDYRILVSRGNRRPRSELYAFNLTDTIPTVPLPLRSEDQEPAIALHPLLDQVYDRAGFATVIDYGQAPVPPVSEQQALWIDNLLHQKNLR